MLVVQRVWIKKIQMTEDPNAEAEYEMILVLEGNLIATLRFKLIEEEDRRFGVFGEGFGRLNGKDFPPAYSLNLSSPIEVYYKPTVSDQIKCETTSDFLYCILRDYPDESKVEKKTWMGVWARKDGKYQGNGSTYRIEKLDVDRVDGVSAVVDYSGNKVVYARSMDGSKGSLVQAELESSVRIQFKDPKTFLKKYRDSTVVIRVNEWSSRSETTLKVRVRDLVEPDFGIEVIYTTYWTIFIATPMILILFAVVVYIVVFKRGIKGLRMVKSKDYEESIKNSPQMANQNNIKA